MHCQPQPQAQPRLASAGRPKAGRRRYKTFMIDEILSKETCDYFEKLSLYSVCPSLLVRPKPLHSCAGKHRKSPRTLPGVGVFPGEGERSSPLADASGRPVCEPSLSCLGGASQVLRVPLLRSGGDPPVKRSHCRDPQVFHAPAPTGLRLLPLFSREGGRWHVLKLEGRRCSSRCAAVGFGFRLPRAVRE